ncbi:hypothetical protein [Nocardia jiangsuensis]|uniref:ATP/GTP-binding protein n=1 Tax=Nocardia jiangsuensis TaxID=1691563 RepID=A0ABV8E002_9NOCA
MPRRDLHAVFRSNDPDLRAVDVFTNRESEYEAVVRSIRTVRAETDSQSFDVEDMEQPRRNVLVFYGVGGIGKTTLSKTLTAWLADPRTGPSQWQPPEQALPRTVPIRVDLARSRAVDIESIVLTVRAELSVLGRPMPAFDLALQRYWEHNRPGESLQAHLASHSGLRRFADSLPAQIDSAIGDAAQLLGLPGTVGLLAGRGIAAAIRGLRQRRRRHHALACRRLPDLLDADPDIEALSFYPHLLAWDLAHLPGGRSALPVIMLDTFEDVGDRTDRERERLLQRLVWLMPNAVFVITGRNRLQWDDERLNDVLDWAGTRCWPQLGTQADGEPRQHLVGYLSPQDCHDYLARRITHLDEPLIPPHIRAIIATRSEGLPLYLDLAVTRYLTLYRRLGTMPAMREIDHDFAALVDRIFRDLTTEERHMARAVSLFDSFSVDLATATAGLERDGVALRLIDRPFIEHDSTGLWPYRLHNPVRSALRDADHRGEDSWSAADWRRAAQRAFDALGTGRDRTAARGDRRILVNCLTQGLRLARDFDLPLDWLIDAAFAYVGDSVWDSLEVGDPLLPRGFPPPTGGAATALITTLGIIARRNRVPRHRTADELRAVLDAGHLPPDLVELPRYYLAMCERDLGHLAASMNGMRLVADAGGRLSADAARGLFHLARRLGRFRDALTTVETLGDDGKQHRARGELWWSQGDISMACACLARARDDAFRAGFSGEAALCQAYLSFSAAFEDRPRALEQIDHATNLLGAAPVGWATLQVEVARLVADAGHDPELPGRARAVAATTRAAGLSSLCAYASLAACFHAAVLESDTLTEQARSWLYDCVHGDEFAYLIEIAHMFTGSNLPPDVARADWIEGQPAARNRWRLLVSERRRQLMTTERT